MSKKQTRALILSPLLLLLTAVGFLAFKASLFGQAQLREASINGSPLFSQPPVIALSEGGIAAIDLTEYFSDPDGDELVHFLVSVSRASLPTGEEEAFAWVQLDEIDEIVMLSPSRGTVGTYLVRIEAFDVGGKSVAGDIPVIVNPKPSSVAGPRNPVGPSDPPSNPKPQNPGSKPVQDKRPIGNPNERWLELKEKASKPVRKVRDEKELADGLRDFRDSNPDHPQVANARALEALSLIRAWKLGDDSEHSRRVKIATEARLDSSLPLRMRARVAAAEDNAAVEMRPHQSQSARIKAFAEVAEGLSSEFRAWPVAYESLVGIAQISEREDALKLLARVKSSKHATDRIKELATEVETRFSLVGDRLDKYLDPGGRASFQSFAAESPTVLYTWSASEPWSLKKAISLASIFNPKTRFFGICLDESASENSRRAAGAAGIPGLQLYLDNDTSLLDKLHLDRPGMGYLLDGKGRIVSVSLSSDSLVELGILDPSLR